MIKYFWNAITSPKLLLKNHYSASKQGGNEVTTLIKYKSNIMKYIEQYDHIKSVLRKLGEDSPDMMQHFGALHKSSTKEGALSNKTKELIALGISIVIRCNECINYHLNDALKAGASDEEILETINVSVVMGGGPALMYATHAYEALKELRSATPINI